MKWCQSGQGCIKTEEILVLSFCFLWRDSSAPTLSPSLPFLLSCLIIYHYPKCKLTAMFYKVIRKNRRLLLIYITMTKIAIIPCQNVCPEPCRWIAELILNAPKVPLPRPTRAFLSVHLRFQAHIRLPICVML